MEIRKQPNNIPTGEIERRTFRGDLSSETPGGRTVKGYAALFNSTTEIWPGFFETIAPGAFRNAIPKSDIRLLFNHDEDIVMGRQSPGRSNNTLTVREDDKGLPFECTLGDARGDVLEMLSRGDVDQCSFAFKIKTAEWTDHEDGSVTRTIMEVAELYDVSIVTYPAYQDTMVDIVSNSTRAEFERRSAARRSQKPITETDPAPDTKLKYKLRRRALALNSK